MRVVGIATFSAFVETSFNRITCNFVGVLPGWAHTNACRGDLSFVVHRASLVRLFGPYLACLCLAMKPTAPLLALPCSGMKPPSPLRAIKSPFRAILREQRVWRFQWGVQRGEERLWRFQWGVQRGEQRCCRFQSRPVIASCARKSSRCSVWCGCEREKVRPARPKRAKNAVFRCAGRTFSRNCCGTDRGGRVFSRKSRCTLSS